MKNHIESINGQGHTPGPWTIEEGRMAGGVVHLAITGPNGQMPASISPMHLRRAEDDANARLIAAAPELLEALRDLLAYAKAISEPGWNVEKRKAQQAIDRAEGRL